MAIHNSRATLLVMAAVMIAIFAAPVCAVTVWTEHNDNGRTGDNLSETILTPSNVNQSGFGKLWTANLDDEDYSQPLYVPSLTINGSTHNAVYATTVNDSVYCFDADSGAQLWQVNLLISGDSVPSNAQASAWGACSGDYVDFQGKFGIVGTPVINTSTNTMYLVARSYNGSAYMQQLHALNILTGAEVDGGPVTISGSYNGVSFNPQLNNQRPALSLVNGVVYIAWSSHCDFGSYNGFVIGYNASNLTQTNTWADTSNGGTQGGIWMGGQGLTVDSSDNLYVMTGNGTWDGIANFGESFVKLSPTLGVMDYFTPSTWSSLNGSDLDVGSAGALGIPGTGYIFGGGKTGIVYLVNTANMGHEGSTDSVVQEFQATFPPSGDTGHIHGGPVYFNSGSAQYVYLWGENDYMRCFQFNGSTFNSTPVGLSTMKAPTSGIGMPGGFISVSANGTSNGIIWALTSYNGDANHNTVPGILHAFNAIPSGGTMTELWNSEQNASRDSFGNYAKDTYPTVANGKVYVATFGSASSGSGTLCAYGLLATAPPAPTGLTAGPGNTSITLNWNAASNATSYNVYRSTTSGGEGATPIISGLMTASYVNTGLANGTTYYYTVAAVNSYGTSAQSSQASAVPGTSTVIQIDAGSGSAVSPFAADTDFNTGNEFSSTATINPNGQTNPAPAAVYQTVRWNSSFAYTIGGLSAGTTYTVRLHFCELTWTAAGQRVFNVAVNGTGWLSSFDIFKTAGGQNDALIEQTTAAANSSGQIVISFTQGSADNPEVAGIEILGSNPSCSATPSAPTGLSASGTTTSSTNLSWSAVTPPANCSISSYTVYKNGTSIGTTSTTSFAVTGLSASTIYTFTVATTDIDGTGSQSSALDVTTSASGGSGPVVEIDAGSSSAVSPFVADTDFNAGNEFSSTATINTSGVANPAPATVYQTVRWNSSFNYTIPNLTAGTPYTVRLHFCELSFTAAGQRVFNVAVNGTSWLSNFDIVKTAGGANVALIEQTTATANSSGQVVISFTQGTADNPEVAGVEIDSIASGPPTAPTGLDATGGQGNIVLTWGASTGETGYNVYRGTSPGGESGTALASGLTSTTYTDTSVTAGTTYYYKVAAVNSSGPSSQSNEASAHALTAVIQIDAGSPSPVSPFVADTDFNTGNEFSSTATINLNGQINPAPAAIYQTVRWNDSFNYTIGGLTSGSTYTVRLHFCELSWTASGQRLFNVSINGNSYLSNFDVFATAGGQNKALVEQTTAAANGSGQIVVSFTQGTADNPEIAGIEVLH